MTNEMTKTLIECFNGKGAHVDAIKVIAGLTASDARTAPKPGVHGIWANLHHMVFWYDVTLEAIQGKKMNWKELRKKEWPSEKEMEDDRRWDELTSKFKKDMENIEKVLSNLDLSQPVPAFDGESIGKAMWAIVRHNSYHLGQMVVIRQLMGKWSSSKEI